MDLRYAIRSLKRNPGFTLVAVLTLALGIGANTTVFSWMEGLVLDPFPAVRDPSRLVSVKLLTHGETSDLMSYPTFAALRAGARAVDGMAAFQFTQFGLQERASSGSAGPVWGAFASSDYFTTLGVRPVLGRGFLPSDSIAGAEPIVLLGNALWRRRFGGDPNVIGRHVRINGHDAVVVGIAPPNFAGALAGLGLELWVPLTNYDQLGDRPGSLRSPYSSWLTVFGRLHPGASMAQARAELAAAARRAASEQPEMDATSATATPFEGGAAPRILTPMFTALLGVTALVLLIVCANLANLMLGRAVARRREFGVRAALGAGRARLVRQQLVECLAIAVPGAVLGVALASWGRDALAALVPATNMPIVVDAPLDLRVMAFVVVLTLAAVVLFGLLPAMRASRIDLVAALKSGTAGAGMRRSRLRGAFVVAQVALSVVAVTSAVLFVRTLRALERIDPGFHDPGRVLLVSTDFAFTGIRDTARVRTTVDRLIERTSAIPGVTGVAAASYVPMGLFGGDNLSLSLPGYTPARDEHPSAWMTHVTPGYFDVMRIPIVAGRALAATDPANDSARAIVVNESFAQRYLPGRDPVGASIALGFSSRPNATIVGVARNVVRAFDVVPTLSGPASPAIYAAYAGRPTTNVTLHVRAAGDPLALVTSVRSAFADVAPALPVLSPETMAEHATMAFFVQRVSATVLGALGAIVLLLAALGLYGVTAYAVTEQTHEVGVRIALGATTRQVVGEFLRQGLRLTAIGLGIGALLALASGRLLESQLYGVHGYDPVALVGASSLLALVALAASYVPARRAAAVDPIIALRAD
jgi:predicted permease